MNKLANMRHWSGGLGPGGFMGSRPNMNMTAIPPQPHQKIQNGISPITPTNAADAMIHYSFNVPFASNLAGPNTEDILHATNHAIDRWTHPAEAADDVPIHELPYHAENVANLRRLCNELSNGPLPIEAHVKSTVSKRAKGQIVNVCLTGSPELVYKSRETILNDTPLALRCATVDIDGEHVIDRENPALKKLFVEFLNDMSRYCGVDIFLLGPKNYTTMTAGVNGDADVGSDSRLRIAIYGDMESAEHAKTRILVFIDRLLGRVIDGFQLELSMHTVVCGRARKNIKIIESSTGTAIYFPPPFSPFYRYTPKGATRRNPSEIFITGESPQHIKMAKQKMHELATTQRLYMKDATVACSKIDSILLGRMDKIRKIMETNGTFILFPTLASQRPLVRIQGVESLHVERTIRELMSLTGQFYSSTWWIQHPAANTALPTPSDIRDMLTDICANSGADVTFDKLTFTITGSDDAVKAALAVIANIRFAIRAQYQIGVKIELANEHKEFVSGKKNGKINKIMGQSSVQIIFDGFNEYNFNIEVCANSNFEALKTGLDLVEQEMPASISFHVPDQYHKRIIGIGGQHIQRIMKKYSVFVKFSNAMDRGGVGRDDDDIKVDNVICRTPARNAQNLELVKEEILEMVDRADSEFTTQTVVIDRLYHRQLIARMMELDQLEKKWNCKIIFPSTEQASDEVTISGPEHQIPQALDDFLGMVPDSHELVLSSTEELENLLASKEFRTDTLEKIKAQYEVNVSVSKDSSTLIDVDGPTVTLLFTFTRRNAGWIKDVVDCLVERFIADGIDATIIKGSLPRPKSDSFEESLPYFDSKLLQHAPAPIATDSPTKTSFDDVGRERTSASTLFEKLRKPGSMSSIFSNLDRRKNSSVVFKNGSNNVSKSSLISIESTRSFNADRNPWNDSGVNLPDEDNNPWPSRQFGNGNVDYKQAFNSMPMHPGDVTPRHNMRGSQDSGRPSTSHSMNAGYPGPIGPPR